ncbi:alpha/beta hydrolase family protein [Archangium sp.]|uniref:alpha/beta hydrolase family protein n=1 Tax=Archangium sp. TaxID=1872627 RepID=UPI003899A1D9
MRRAVLLLGALLWSPLALATPPPARPSVDAVIDDLNRTVRFRQAALSPEGSRVAWVESVPDSEVPVTQGFEFWKALKTLGVETQLVVYADEGHGLRRPEHLRDRSRRTVQWFDTHLAPPPAPKAPAPPR